MNENAVARYRARFRKVLEFVDAHLDEDLCAQRLGTVAAFSPFHFQRQFSATFGVGVHRYVQLRRLKRATYALAFRADRSVLDVALDSGYEAPEAFARAFKKNLGQSPSAFRDAPEWVAWHRLYEPLRDLRRHYMADEHGAERIRVVDFPTTRVAALTHRGAPQRMGDTVRAFIAWRRANGLAPNASATFNVVYQHEDDACHYDLCAATDREIAPNALGVVAKTIPGGRCALLRHVGSEDTLADAVNALYAQWLPRSGEEPRDFPLFFQRVSMFPDVPEHEAITDVYLPLKSRHAI